MTDNPSIEEQIHLVRNKVKQHRLQLEEDLIKSQIEWSVKSSKRNKFIRFLYNLPSAPFTKEQALKSLEYRNPAEQFDHRAITGARLQGKDVLEVCDVIEGSKAMGMSYYLSRYEIVLFQSWLNKE